MFKDGKPAQNFPQTYDSHINITIPYYHTFNTEIINLVRAAGPEPQLWLDTGCGTGTLAGEALQAFNGTKFILADPSPEMLAVAKSKLESKYSPRVLFMEKSTTQEIILPGGEKPDVITAVLCHHYLQENGRVEATRKCYELLKPGGLYVTFENIMPFTHWRNRSWQSQLEKFSNSCRQINCGSRKSYSALWYGVLPHNC